MNSQSDIHAEGSMAGNLFLRHPIRHLNAGASSTNRLEIAWAWASLLMLIICWDAALRLDQRVSVSRVRIAHAAEPERPVQTGKLAEL